jgi:8-oxo-dGTP diphosphatase
MSVGRFLAMIGALLWCPSSNKYLVLRRSQDRDVGGGHWECVTGRLDQGEGFSDAVRREVNEEVGVEAQVEFIIGTNHMYRGDKKPENEMVGVFYCCSIDDPETIQVSSEHSEHRWVNAEEVRELLPDEHWLVRVIERAETIRAQLPSGLLELYRIDGFEFGRGSR